MKIKLEIPAPDGLLKNAPDYARLIGVPVDVAEKIIISTYLAKSIRNAQVTGTEK